MELLAQKLAEFLDISIESAVEVYPILREQFKIYKLLDGLSLALGMVTVVAIILLVVFLFKGIDEYESEREGRLKTMKIIFFIGAGTAVFSVLLSCLMAYAAPDLMMLKEFLR